MEKDHCDICKREMEPFMLSKCPMCHKYFCEECGYKHGGLGFCSRNCAYLFYYPDPDDMDEE